MLQTGIKITVLTPKQQNQIKYVFPQEKVFKYSLKHLNLGLYRFWFIFYSQSSKLKFSQKNQKKYFKTHFFSKKREKIEKMINFVRNPLNINENDA